MRKLLRIKMGAFCSFLLLSVCLSASYPPHITKLQEKLIGTSGTERVRLLFRLGEAISPYDFEAGTNYLSESDSIANALKGISDFEKLKLLKDNLYARSWALLYDYQYFDAFQATLKTDSMSLLFESSPDSLQNERWLGHLSANTVRNAIFMNQKLYLQAQRELESAIKSCENLTGKDRNRIGSVYSNLGINLMLQKKFDESERSMQRADSIFSSINSDFDLAFCKMFQTDLYIRSKKWKKAMAIIDDALHSIKVQYPSREPLMTAYAARIYYENDLVEKSDSFVQVGFKALEQLEDKGASIWYKREISILFERQNRYEEAIKLRGESNTENDVPSRKLYSDELLKLQETYFQSKYPSPTKNENYPFWIFLSLASLVAVAFKFFYKEKPPRVIIEQIQTESQKLEIAWKHENASQIMADPFVERFVINVQNSIDDGDVSVDKIADVMHISRVQLFRKVKAATGESPSVLIRQIRLKTAERLLIENAGNISEVAYRVGFSNPNSFSRAFKDHFGSSPKEYLLKQHG